MKKYFNYPNYGNDLYLTKEDVIRFGGVGDKSEEVDFLLSQPYIKKQVLKWNKTALKNELKEYGAWSKDELKNHTENIRIFIWVSASNIAEELQIKLKIN